MAVVYVMIMGALLQCAGGSFGCEHATSRYAMVDLIASQGVTDPAVLQAMARVPRHAFVPAPMKAFAYADQPLPIGAGQTISQPFIVAFMTDAAAVRPGDKVLEIGTGCGYQAAVLAEMGARVYSVEIIRELAEDANARLHALGYGNVNVRHGDGYGGWPEHGPYQAIVVTAAAPRPPPQLLAQLAEGGRLIIPVDYEPGAQMLQIYTRRGETFVQADVLPVRFVPMTGCGRDAACANG